MADDKPKPGPNDILFVPVPEPIKSNLLFWNDDLNYIELKNRLNANL
jgi:hypothetical protein